MPITTPSFSMLFEVMKENFIPWLVFLALPVIIFLFACLIPRGKGVALITFERLIVLFVIFAVIAAPFIIDIIKPDLLGFDPFQVVTGSNLTMDSLKDIQSVSNFFDLFFPLNNSSLYLIVLLVLALVVFWGAFTGRSYITQAIYGMVSTVIIGYFCVYGLYNILYPSIVIQNAGFMEDGIFKLFSESNPFRYEFIYRLIQYAVIFFVPCWLIRTGEYKIRLSAVSHLFGGISIGGGILLFLSELEYIRCNLCDIFLVIVGEFRNAADSGDFLHYKISKDIAEYFYTLVGLFVGAVMVILMLSLLVIIVRAFAGSKASVVESDGFLGFILRTFGSTLTHLCCFACICVYPFMIFPENATLPMALIYLAPIVIYAAISLVTIFLADMADIKGGIKRARTEERARVAAHASQEAQYWNQIPTN